MFKTNTAKKAILVTGGNLAGQALGFLATLILIRQLGPERFGTVSIAIAILGMAGQLADFGLSTAFVRFAAQYLKHDQIKAALLMQVTLYLKLGFATAVLIIGCWTADLLAARLFKNEELSHIIKLAFVGSFGVSLWGYWQCVLQAREQFAKYVWANTINSALKLTAIGALAVFNLLAEVSAVMVLVLMPFAAFFIDSLLVPRDFLKIRGSFEQKKLIAIDLFHFSKWVTISTLCTMLTMRIDVLLLQGMATTSEVGVYGGASQLAMVFSLVTGSLTTVLLPYVAGMKDAAIKRYSRNILKTGPFIVFGYLAAYFLSPSLVDLLLGDQYLESIPILRILLLGFSISLMINPLSVLFFSFNKPELLTFLNIVQLLIAVPACYYLIPVLGGVGAAWSSVIVRVVSLVFVYAALKRLIYNENS